MAFSWAARRRAAHVLSRGTLRPLRRARTIFHRRTPLCGVTPFKLQIRAISSAFAKSEEHRLVQLERDADGQPDNARRQTALYQSLNKGHPQSTILRFESGRFAYDLEGAQEYVNALQREGRLDRLDLPSVLRGATDAQVAQQTIGPPPTVSTPAQAVPGSKANPLLVKFKPAPPIDFAFQMLLRVAGLLVTMYVLRHYIAQKLPGGTTKVKPAENSGDTTFADVLGCDEAKEELKEVVEFLKEPEKFTRLGGKIPHGVLLMGPPGTGKTLLAKAVAGEASVPFFYFAGSEFEEMYVGVGARRVRELFAAARAHAPAVVFVDEIDAVGGKRTMQGGEGGSGATRATLNQLLVEMDGFERKEGDDPVIVISATNFGEDDLDPALLRPGRFDRHVSVPVPDLDGRRQILEHYAKKMTLSKAADMHDIARGTPGCSGAQLFNLLNSAALRASSQDKLVITQGDLEYAKDKILMGPERLSAQMTEESRTRTAYHEGGHALVAIRTKGAHPIHKATIMPRGQSLGMVHQLPENELSENRETLLAQLTVCMGGRVAEELMFGPEHVTTGASSDLYQANRLAKAMVLRYGFGARESLVSVSDQALINLSPDRKSVIDQEMGTLLDEAYARAEALLSENKQDLETLAKGLLKYETLNKDEILSVLAGEALDRAITH
mmetsp:Transcript_7448/g.8442  ORF Transcript_7448/g.8442 Transcript_7448/m.8442 type:complete len:668 (-) Transcript_7448:97-2100(-)